MGNSIQYITINNREMAILPKEDLDTLIKDKAEGIIDISIYDDIKRKLASGEEEYIPGEFAKRLLNGENKIRVFRELRKLNQKQLAEHVNVSQSYINALENTNRQGSIDVIRKIAEVLNISMEDIVPKEKNYKP